MSNLNPSQFPLTSQQQAWFDNYSDDKKNPKRWKPKHYTERPGFKEQRAKDIAEGYVE